MAHACESRTGLCLHRRSWGFLLNRLLNPLRRAYAWFLWDYLGHHKEARNWILFALKKRYPIFLEYPVKPQPRYGYGKPPHPGLYEIINRNRTAMKITCGSSVHSRRTSPALPFVAGSTRLNRPGKPDAAGIGWPEHFWHAGNTQAKTLFRGRLRQFYEVRALCDSRTQAKDHHHFN